MSESFPLKVPRKSQADAMDFMDQALNDGFKHIVIEAPTGTGKTLLGAACCLSAGQGYYLVTQKMLQDQLENELASDPSLNCRLLKSAVEYGCGRHKNCALGSVHKCKCIQEGNCTYSIAKSEFVESRIGVTNYPFFLAERFAAGKLPQRPIMVLDECHTIERQILGAVDFVISSKQFEKWNIELEIPVTTNLQVFFDWVGKVLIPKLEDKIKTLLIISDSAEDKVGREAIAINQHTTKLKMAMARIKSDPSGWIFWQQETDEGFFEAIIRPLNAAPFSPTLFNGANVNVHMSAFPGRKEVYCRSLGLDPESVAWFKATSSFAPKNRPVIWTPVARLRKSLTDESLPKAIKFTLLVLDKHEKQKGLIHSNSYKFSEALYTAIRSTKHASRIIYPKTSEERDEAVKLHRMSPEPTVIISPSMTEGYDFPYDSARWQIILKTPFPNLGDKQVNAKRELDREWYTLETIKTIVQASGRICRADDDWGVTYILDADLDIILDKSWDAFPDWWRDGFVRR